MTGDKLALGAVAALTVAGLAKQRGSKSEDRPKYLYHSTFLENLDDIAENGITTSEGSQFGGGYAAYSRGRVFLSGWPGVFFWMSKMEQIAHDNSDFDSDDDFGWTPINLRVRSEGIDHEMVRDERGYRDSGFKESWYIEGDIDPEFIEVWDGATWEPITSADSEDMREEAMDNSTLESEDGMEWWDINFDIFMPRRG